MDVTLNHHISEICKSSLFRLRNIGLIRKYLTNDATEQLVHALVTSRLDMGNSLPYGLPALQIKRLSRLQNKAARIITLSRLQNKAGYKTKLLELATTKKQEKKGGTDKIHSYKRKRGTTHK